jgi:hypothetical protein
MYRLRLQPQFKILIRHSKFRALIATITITLILYLKIGYKSKKQPDDSRGGGEMSYRFIIIKIYIEILRRSQSLKN